MPYHFDPKGTLWLPACLVAALILTACGGKNWFSYNGWETKPENRYTLKKGGPHAVIWKSREFDLHYRYRLEGDRLEVEGTVVRQNPIKHFNQLQAWVNIHLLDENGIILDTHRLWSQRGSTAFTGLRWTFRQTWQIPPGNEAVGFSFSGTAGDNDTRWEFWQTP
jgi:hypothetical protein